MWKKCKVVMLATNEKAVENSLMLSQNNSKHLTIVGNIDSYQVEFIPKNGYGTHWVSNFTHQHLYILSDEKIKVGDWYYNPTDNQFGQPHIEKCEFDHEAKACLEEPVCKKIIASTNKLLGLPELSQKFVELFVSEFKKGNVIKDVMVEYNGLTSMDEMLIKEYNISKNSLLEASSLKINSEDNTIITKKVKDTWNKKEIEELLLNYHIHCFYPNPDPWGSDHEKNRNEIVGWIENNVE